MCRCRDRTADRREPTGQGARRAGHGARAAPVRPANPGASRQEAPNGARRTRPGEPAGAGGVRGARGALQLPVHPTRGREGRAQGPARRDRRRRRPHPAGFAEAYADVEREFTQVFATLFPGGEGRLLLTDPDDMLTSGIEVRPPARQEDQAALAAVRWRESLTAVAMLVAIFRARPSPFYVMDKVEAALDDVDLGV